MARKTITVHGYRNNGMKKPRTPLVHIMGYDTEFGELQSITFSPEYAERFARAVLTAARQAKRGKDWKREVCMGDER